MIPVLLQLVQAVSSVRLYIPKDLKPLDARQNVGKSIQEVKKRFKDGLPLLDPIDDMGIKDEGLKSIVRVLLIISTKYKILNFRQHFSVASGIRALLSH